MKNKTALWQLLITLVWLLVGDNVNAEKLDLQCDAAKFKVETIEEKALLEGHIRFVSPLLAGLLSTATYSNRRVIECDKNDSGSEAQCLGLNNSLFCKDPQNTFRIRGIKSNNSLVMVQDRCNGGYKKYVLADPDIQVGDKIFLEDRMFFKLKNQLFATGDLSSYKQPVLRLSEVGQGYILYVESFDSYDHFPITELQPGREFSVDTYDTPPLEKFSLPTVCR